MTKKTYRPTVFLSIAIPIFIVLIALSSYYLYDLCFLPKSIDEDIMLWQRVLYMIIGLISLPFLVYELIKTIVRQRIVLTDNEIFTPQNSFFKKASYQFEVHIPYAEIVDIACKYSSMTSKNTPDPNRPKGPRKYAVFTLKNGKIRRVSLAYYTPKHSACILDDIISRCAEVGNVLDVPNGKIILESRFKNK